MLTTREAHQAWGDIINDVLREPTDAEIAKLMPADHPLPLDKMTVGDYLDFKKNVWKAAQVSQIIYLLKKETAYARRNEHHQLGKIFGKEVWDGLPQSVKDAVKVRFDELNAEVKGEKVE